MTDNVARGLTETSMSKTFPLRTVLNALARLNLLNCMADTSCHHKQLVYNVIRQTQCRPPAEDWKCFNDAVREYMDDGWLQSCLLFPESNPPSMIGMTNKVRERGRIVRYHGEGNPGWLTLSSFQFENVSPEHTGEPINPEAGNSVVSRWLLIDVPSE